MPRNELFGWTWILAGMLTGMVLGLFFHREDWLGGYASHPRRLLRLGHVSFIGLGVLNVLFALTGQRLHVSPPALGLASWALVTGGVTMPACCALLAWKRTLQPAFTVPVASLLLGVAVVVTGLLRR